MQLHDTLRLGFRQRQTRNLREKSICFTKLKNGDFSEKRMYRAPRKPQSRGGRVMTINGHMADLFAELEEFRITRDWTYLQLADAIAETTHRHRDEDCWRRICQGLTARPHGRTIAILESFLASMRRPRRRTVRRSVA
jgi:hypothetical protein